MHEIPQLLDGRVEYFDACLFAVLWAQVHKHSGCFLYISPKSFLCQKLYFDGCRASIKSCLHSLKIDENDLNAAVKPEAKIQHTTQFHLTTIQTLSIVGGPQ